MWANRNSADLGRRGTRGAACFAALLCVAGVVAADDDGRTPVAFPAADGHQISADFYAPATKPKAPPPMVILLHMYRSDRTAWAPLIQPLREAGFAVLALDLRGHGESATTETRDKVIARDQQIFRDMQNDVRGAYDFLAGRGDVDRARFALVGASVGTSIALQYAAKDRSVDVIVGLSPGLNYLGIDSTGDIHQVSGRKVLLISPREEADAPRTLKAQGHDVDVRIITEAQAHGTDLFGKVPGLERDIVEYLKRNVGEPSDRTVCGSINSDVYHARDSEWVREISPTNLRIYSSTDEARARGLRESKSKGPTDRGKSDSDRRPKKP